jgi:hypothetical protein
MNPSQLKSQLSLDGVSLSDQQNLEIWVLLDKLARIEYNLYLEEKSLASKAIQHQLSTLAIYIKMQHK